MNWAMEVVSSATKIVIRSRPEAMSVIPRIDDSIRKFVSSMASVPPGQDDGAEDRRQQVRPGTPIRSPQRAFEDVRSGSDRPSAAGRAPDATTRERSTQRPFDATRAVIEQIKVRLPVWKHEHYVDGDDRWLELNDVRLFEFDQEGRLASVAHARIAEHRSTGWLLRDVRRTRFEERSVAQTDVAEERWDSTLDSAALAANAGNIWRPRYMSSTELKQGIEYRERNQLDASEFEEYYWGHWFYPLNVLALCLAAIPFAFGSLRSGGLGRRLFIGVVFALGFWLLQTQVVKLAAVYSFDYRIAYLMPPLMMLAVSWFLFRRRSG